MTIPASETLSPADKQQLLLKTFPARARKVNHSGVSGKYFWKAVSSLFGAVLVAFLIWFWLPDIVRDARLVWFDSVVVESEADVSGSCKIYKMVLISCDAKISYRPDPGREDVLTVEQHTSFFGFSHSTKVDVLRSTTHPERITTSIATEHLGNRIISFLLLVGLIVLLEYVACSEAWNAFRHGRLQGREVVLRPLLVRVYECDADRNVKFVAEIDGVERHSANVLRYGDAPLFLPWSQNVAVALLASGTRYMILLDEEMTVADFSESEKALLKTLLS
ncbi:hypothetical protein INH39_16055 [Massilia violaceinigra]|uniref:DUF3592 domain-containing protein n=1 Tax=Massilia violaceinigra TaxID=2045208 RepID=A0ABY4AGF4_9BURK|nr:hypothetical protein [Massilia violaceinigra]UOD33009.1 hypothetical protein INH39_16055 [Massilia violaceinigra]